MIDHYYAVIMAGGGGTRLWPLSRRERPKQMLRLGGEQTLFQMAVSRLGAVFSTDHILVVTVSEQAELLKKQCPEIPVDNFLIEPMPRGTASVVGLAAIALKQRDPNAVMAVLTADHYIDNIGVFHKLLLAAEKVAQTGSLVTLGIQPTYAATGYGYVQRGDKLGAFDGVQAYQALRFKEKPNEETADKFIQSGDHDWNSGMFIWRVDAILDEIGRHMPALNHQLMEIQQSWGRSERDSVIATIWPQIEPQTIDYGIMEKAGQVAVLPAVELGWNDVGSWESLFDVLPADENGNILISVNHLGIETKNSLICADGSDRLIVTIGASDLVIVDTGDALLVCPKNDSQKVREVVNLLKKLDRNEYL